MRRELQLAKMAIADIMPGVKTKRPDGLYLMDREGFDHGHNLHPTWYDYSHLHPDYHIYTADSKDNRNGKFSRSIAIDPQSKRLVGYVIATDRKFYDPTARFPTYKVGAAEVMEAHRNKKLGRRLYEALYSHLYHKGVKNIVGGDHSTMAARIHEKLAADHGLEYKNRTGGELGKPYDDKYPPYEYALKSELNKALPRNEHENQANAASHEVMEDAILEQGGKKTVEADGRGATQLSDEEWGSRQNRGNPYFTPDGTPKNFDPRTQYEGVDKTSLEYTHPEKFFAGVGWKPYNHSPVDRIFDPLNDGDNWEDERQGEYERWSDGVQRVANIPQEYYRDPRPRISEHRATASQILNPVGDNPHSIPNWNGPAVERRNNFEHQFWSDISRQSGSDLYNESPLLDDVKKAIPSSMKENKMLEEHDAVLKDKLMGEGRVVQNPHDNVDPSATKYNPGSGTTGHTEMYLRDADINSNSAYPSIPPIPLKSGTGNWYSFSNGGRHQSFKGTKGMVVYAHDRDGNTVGSAIVHEPRLLLDGSTMSTIQPLYWANAIEWTQIHDHMTRSLQDKGLIERMFGTGIKLKP